MRQKSLAILIQLFVVAAKVLVANPTKAAVKMKVITRKQAGRYFIFCGGSIPLARTIFQRDRSRLHLDTTTNTARIPPPHPGPLPLGGGEGESSPVAAQTEALLSPAEGARGNAVVVTRCTPLPTKGTFGWLVF